MEEQLQKIHDEIVALRVIVSHMAEPRDDFQKVADDMMLSLTNLSYRVYNTLGNYGIVTVGDLKNISLNELRKYRNLGKHSIEEIKRFVADNNIRIKGSEVSVSAE